MKNINLLPILLGDINKCSLSFLSNFLKSDIYIVFGSSYIKGELADFLIKKKQLTFTWEYRHIIEVVIVIFGHYLTIIHISRLYNSYAVKRIRQRIHIISCNVKS